MSAKSNKRRLQVYSQRDQLLDGQLHRLVHLDIIQASTSDSYSRYDSLNRQVGVNVGHAGSNAAENRDTHTLSYATPMAISAESDLYWDKQIVRVIPR